MNWRATEYADLFRVKVDDESSADDVRSLLQDNEETRSMLLEYAHTFECNGDAIAIVGVAPMWSGVGTVWSLLSEHSKNHGIPLTRASIRFIEERQAQGFWRLQATVERGHWEAREWILALGFSYEGTMVGYGPDGKTHDMYARLRGACRWP